MEYAHISGSGVDIRVVVCSIGCIDEARVADLKIEGSNGERDLHLSSTHGPVRVCPGVEIGVRDVGRRMRETINLHYRVDRMYKIDFVNLPR